MEIRNLTPHVVRVIDAEGNVKATFPVAGKPAWVKAFTSVEKVIDGIPFAKVAFGEVENLPPYSPSDTGRRYIVSSVVLNAVQATSRPTDDLLVPVEMIRDNYGSVIGCQALRMG